MPFKRPKGTPVWHTTPLESYSGHFPYAPLPPQAYPYATYPHYPPMFYPPPGPPYSNPKYYRTFDVSHSPPPEKELHDLLDNENKRDFYWDIRTSPTKKFQFRTPEGSVSYITEDVLGEEALGPKGKDMRIVCDRYPWTIEVKKPSGANLTLKVFLETIYNCLHEPLTEDEWKELTSGEKRNAHISRGLRLAYDATSFNVDGRVKRVDVLGERSMFSGLRPDDQTEGWVLILSKRPISRKT